jgi:benzylsuccinate CoA-transferase BbsF subunit
VILYDELSPHAGSVRAALASSTGDAVTIYVRGFPAGSAREGQPFTDLTITAASGELPLNGFPGGLPLYPAGDQGYRIASLVAAAGGLAALFAKRHGGSARAIDVSAQEAMALSTVEQASVNQWLWYSERTARLGPETRGHGGLFQAKDGKWLILNINEGRRFLRWAEDAGLGPEGGFGPDWDDHDTWMARYDAGVLPLIRALAGRHTAAELVRDGQAHRLLAMPVADVAEVLANEQLADRGFFEREDGAISFRLPWTVRAGEEPAGSTTSGTRSPSLHEGGDAGPRGPLAGLRILEFCGGIAGPLTARFFANLGAEVIKIESEDPPDVLRMVGLQAPGSTSLNTNAVFNDCNTGKFSLALNLRSPEAISVVKELVRDADALLTSFTPGVLEKFDLGFEDLAAVNPRLIYYASSVYGTRGPLAGYRSYGSGICAAAGLSLVMGFPEEPPVGLGNYHSDYTGPYFSAIALLAALLERDRDPRPRFIDFSQVEGAVCLLGPEPLREYEASGKLPPQIGNGSRSMAPHGVFACAGEDEWCAVAVRSDDEWRRLSELIGRPELGTRYPTADHRVAAADEIEDALAGWFAERTPWDAAAELVASGIAASPVEDNRDLADRDEGMAGCFTNIDHPEGPHLRVMREPMLIDGKRPEAVLAPLVGEHTEFILRRLLGMDDEAMADLVASGAVG